MLVISLLCGIIGGALSAGFAVVNGASWWLALLAYSGGGAVAMLLTLSLIMMHAQRAGTSAQTHHHAKAL